MMQSIMKNSIKPNILIVDDIEENLILIEDLLDSLDVNLITAQSGAEALGKIQDTDIMLALIDVKMPEMNGFDLAEIMQKNTGSELIPVIFITAHTGDQSDIEKYYSTRGVVDYILKPFRNHILLSKVKVFLELHRQKLQIRNQKAEMELMVKELRESKKMYRTLLSSSPQGILILDMKRIITNASDITVEIFGVAGTNEIIGKDFFGLIPDKEYGNIKSILSKTLSEGLVQNEEVTLEKKNKNLFVGEISATLIQGEDGKPKAYMVIIRDISQRKMIEQQLIRSERMVSLGEMASGMAHEINQPLLSIQFGIENLLNKIQQPDGADTKYLKRKAESIFDDISRINHIIDHVRAFSKDQEYILTTFDVNESISNAISMISQQFKQREIKLTLNLEKEPGLVYGNTYKFEQAILNLLSNARDAIAEKANGGNIDYVKQVFIRSFTENNSIIIEVEDNGIGIESNEFDRLFLPFYSNKDKGKGSGLGLAITLEIIKELNGTIDFDSKPGAGTVFRIQLPGS